MSVNEARRECELMAKDAHNLHVLKTLNEVCKKHLREGYARQRLCEKHKSTFL